MGTAAYPHIRISVAIGRMPVCSGTPASEETMFIVPQPEPHNTAGNTDVPPAKREPRDLSDAIGGSGVPRLPREIPSGARIVVRTKAGADPNTGRMTYRDFVGHVQQWNGTTLKMIRDAAANGSRPEQQVSIEADSIVRLKPIPERPGTAARRKASDKA